MDDLGLCWVPGRRLEETIAFKDVGCEWTVKRAVKGRRKFRQYLDLPEGTARRRRRQRCFRHQQIDDQAKQTQQVRVFGKRVEHGVKVHKVRGIGRGSTPGPGAAAPPG